MQICFYMLYTYYFKGWKNYYVVITASYNMDVSSTNVYCAPAECQDGRMSGVHGRKWRTL